MRLDGRLYNILCSPSKKAVVKDLLKLIHILPKLLQNGVGSDISVNCNSNLTEMNQISFTETETEKILRTETITK